MGQATVAVAHLSTDTAGDASANATGRQRRTPDDKEVPMPPPTDASGSMSRRRFLHATAAGVLTAATAAAHWTPARAATTGPAHGPALTAGPAPPTADPDFGQLDAKIRAGMARYGIPGVAVGVLAQGHEYVRGYGVTNVDYPVPVDGDTLFRIGSTTKTFTGTTV